MYHSIFECSYSLKERWKSAFAAAFLIFFLSLNVQLLSKTHSPAAKEWTGSPYSQYFRQGEELQVRGEFDKAILQFENAAKLARKTQAKEKECESLLKLGLMHWNTGLLKESAEFYENALFLAKKLNIENFQKNSQDALKIYDLYSQGKIYRSSGQHQKSIEAFDKAIDLARKIGSQEHELKCLRQQSISFKEINRLEEFFSLNKRALIIAKSLNHRKEEGRCLNNIGYFHKQLSDYSRALNYYQEALYIARELKDKWDESERLNNIGNAYRNMGDFEKSLYYLSQALTTDKSLGNEIYISIDLLNIGNIYRHRGLIYEQKEDLLKAITYYKECIKITKSKQASLNKNNVLTGIEVRALNNIGTAFSDLKIYDKALSTFHNGLTITEKNKDREIRGILLNNIGIVHFNLGNYEESTRYFQQAIDLALEIEGGQILWEAYLEIANAYAKQQKYSDALDNYKNSIGIIENVRSQLKLEEYKASYLGTDKRIEAYHNLLHLLVLLHEDSPDKGYDEEAFRYLERGKARAFLDSLELSKVDISTGIDFELNNREKELMKEISKVYNKLLGAQLTSQEITNLKIQLEEKENELESLKREIRTNSPAYSSLKYPEVITLEETQKKHLDSATAFFAYSIAKEKSYAFVITKKDFQIFQIPPKEIIRDLVKNHLETITDRHNKDFMQGYELFQILISPGLNKNIKKIIFVPDDILHFLPFETLITQADKERWLIEDYKISYAPSISSFKQISERKQTISHKRALDILAFGDPDFGSLENSNNGSDVFQEFFSSKTFDFYRLKYSSTEIEKIGSLFKENKKNTFLRDRATENQLKAHNLKNYKIIHFATHSLIDDKKPARSSIVLTLNNDSAEDGFVQMREVYNLNLNSDLVTLSSCQTGLGQFIKGEGIEGLNRAFFYAGSSSVLMSLWAVNDQATSQLMERFYSHLRSSQSIAEALRKAKTELIKSGTLSHPYYWAGFIVSGKADQVIFPQSLAKWFIMGGSLLLLSGIIFIAVRRNGKSARHP